MEKSLGEIMHGLSEENIAREEELFENMPVFPRISRSKNLTMLLVHRVKSCTPVPKGCDILAEGLYVDEIIHTGIWIIAMCLQKSQTAVPFPYGSDLSMRIRCGSPWRRVFVCRKTGRK